MLSPALNEQAKKIIKEARDGQVLSYFDKDDPDKFINAMKLFGNPANELVDEENEFALHLDEALGLESESTEFTSDVEVNNDLIRPLAFNITPKSKDELDSELNKIANFLWDGESGTGIIPLYYEVNNLIEEDVHMASFSINIQMNNQQVDIEVMHTFNENVEPEFSFEVYDSNHDFWQPSHFKYNPNESLDKSFAKIVQLICS